MGELGINLPGLIVQVFNVLLVLIILRLLLYKPILRMLDRRSTRIKEGMESAERMKAGKECSERGSRVIHDDTAHLGTYGIDELGGHQHSASP